MRVWKEFGSSHSGNVTVIGEFTTSQQARDAMPLLEDFVRAYWEERHPDVNGYINAWKEREPNVQSALLTESDYEIGVDNNPDIECSGNQVVITHLRSQNVGGIVKLLFSKGMKEIRISGRGG